MTYVKWTILTAIAVIAAAFLHYSLPRHDVVRIVENEVRRVETGNGLFWANSEPADSASGNRDVKFISAIRESGSPIVYRNEDTGWGWPPYWKFDSADLQARAADFTSNKAAPQWVVVTRYGWRNNLFSIYPNALKLKAVESPDQRIIPWVSIFVLAALVILALVIRHVVKRFWANRVDPVVANVSDAFESADDRMDLAAHRFRGRRQKLREWWTEMFG